MFLTTISNTEKEIIEITQEQKNKFAGNMLQVMGDNPYLVMSDSAYDSLDYKQKDLIKNIVLLFTVLLVQ